MIRKINKIMALVLVATSVSTVTPMGIFSTNAKAAINDNSEININSSTNNVTLASTDDEAAYATVDAALLPTKLAKMSGTVTQFEKCGSISYTLDDTKAAEMAKGLNMAQSKPLLALLGNKAADLIAHGDTTKGTALASALKTVGKDLQGISSDNIVEYIKTAVKDVPIYKYTIKDSTGKVLAQGFAAGGILGLSLNPSDTYNATKKTATYNSVAPIPSLPLTGNEKFGQTMDLSASSTSIICDGLNINVVDSTNNKVYAINNPVFKKLIGSTTDTINVIDFPLVTNLKGYTSSIDLSDQNIPKTTLLGIALQTSASQSKSYQYALPVGAAEYGMLRAHIDKMNLSNQTDTVKKMIAINTYTMIPNIKADAANGILDSSGLGKNIDKITDALSTLNDSLEDLTDELKDKNDDIDDAWDKVFDRFDNSEGWGKRDGNIYYYDSDGVSKKGAQKIDGKTYYFNRIDGAMETGWQIVDGNKCYFDKKKRYEVFNQWVQDGDDWYFVGDNGAVKKMEWVNDGGKSYYLKADGKMTKDWLKIEDYWYYFNQDGSMVTSTWKWSKNKYYYLKDNGQAATDWLQIGDKWYYFKDPSGEMQTGWFRANGNWYCSNDDGSMKTGWASSKDGMCYLDDNTGIMKKNEWVTVDGRSYYFNINGTMVTGSRYIDGTKYVFNSDGTLSA